MMGINLAESVWLIVMICLVVIGLLIEVLHALLGHEEKREY